MIALIRERQDSGHVVRCLYLPVSRAEMKSVFLNSTMATVTAIAAVIGRTRLIFLDLDNITRCSQIIASGPTGGQQRSAIVDTTGRVHTALMPGCCSCALSHRHHSRGLCRARFYLSTWRQLQLFSHTNARMLQPPSTTTKRSICSCTLASPLCVRYGRQAYSCAAAAACHTQARRSLVCIMLFTFVGLHTEYVTPHGRNM